MSYPYSVDHPGWDRVREAMENYEPGTFFERVDTGRLEPVGYVKHAPPEYTRPDFDTYFLDIARAVAARADCRRRKVGAVIVGPDHFMLSTGYNGAPPGAPGCLSGACPRGLLSYDEVKEFSDYSQGPGRCISLHAELNAVVQVGRRSIPAGSTIYITDKPCDGCQKAIAAAGIDRIIFTPNTGGTP